jgi:hypothetical protein
MARAKIDWEAVELDYRTGVKTLRTMAGEHGCAESAIRKKAKEQDWSRDLEEKVRQRAQEKVRKEEVRKRVRTEIEPSERQQIEVMAEVQSDIILSHRKDIQRSRTLAMSLLDEVEDQTMRRELYEKLGELLYAPDENGKDKLHEIYLKVIGSGGRIDSMKKLADTLKTLVALEREAYGLGDDGKNKGAGTFEDWLDTL